MSSFLLTNSLANFLEKRFSHFSNRLKIIHLHDPFISTSDGFETIVRDSLSDANGKNCDAIFGPFLSGSRNELAIRGLSISEYEANLKGSSFRDYYYCMTIELTRKQ